MFPQQNVSLNTSPLVNRVIPAECDLAVVAMSGGVDSCVAALLMAEAGVPAVGVSMQVWDYRQGGSCSKATCCAPSDFTDARMVAARIGIPYYVFDMEEVFKEQVIDRFISEYSEGKTPNPCVECNNKVKFRELRARGLDLGCSHVVTGHYAQIIETPTGWELHRGADSNKDQSYFLYGLLREELAQTVFPVGHLTKPEVRELAKQAGFSIASKPESQDICFISGSVQEFISRVGRIKEVGGTFQNQRGEMLGTHAGVHNFTVGQRRGLNLSGNTDPLYVIGLDPETQIVTVGEKHELELEGFAITGINWLTAEIPQQPFSCVVQVRSRHSGTQVTVTPRGRDAADVSFVGEWVSVSPGQAAVLYGLCNQRVLGGGKISRGRSKP